LLRDIVTRIKFKFKWIKFKWILKFLEKMETLVSKAVSFSVESLWRKEVRFDVLLASLVGKFRRIISYELSADMDEYSLALSLVFSLHESDTIFLSTVLIFVLEHPSRRTRDTFYDAHVYSKCYFFFKLKPEIRK